MSGCCISLRLWKQKPPTQTMTGYDVWLKAQLQQVRKICHTAHKTSLLLRGAAESQTEEEQESVYIPSCFVFKTWTVPEADQEDIEFIVLLSSLTYSFNSYLKHHLHVCSNNTNPNLQLLQEHQRLWSSSPGKLQWSSTDCMVLLEVCSAAGSSRQKACLRVSSWRTPHSQLLKTSVPRETACLRRRVRGDAANRKPMCSCDNSSHDSSNVQGKQRKEKTYLRDS